MLANRSPCDLRPSSLPPQRDVDVWYDAEKSIFLVAPLPLLCVVEARSQAAPPHPRRPVDGTPASGASPPRCTVGASSGGVFYLAQRSWSRQLAYLLFVLLCLLHSGAAYTCSATSVDFSTHLTGPIITGDDIPPAAVRRRSEEPKSVIA